MKKLNFFFASFLFLPTLVWAVDGKSVSARPNGKNWTMRPDLSLIQNHYKQHADSVRTTQTSVSGKLTGAIALPIPNIGVRQELSATLTTLNFQAESDSRQVMRPSRFYTMDTSLTLGTSIDETSIWRMQLLGGGSYRRMAVPPNTQGRRGYGIGESFLYGPHLGLIAAKSLGGKQSVFALTRAVLFLNNEYETERRRSYEFTLGAGYAVESLRFAVEFSRLSFVDRYEDALSDSILASVGVAI